jgi:flagellar hook-length control protein FliK
VAPSGGVTATAPTTAAAANLATGAATVVSGGQATAPTPGAAPTAPAPAPALSTPDTAPTAPTTTAWVAPPTTAHTMTVQIAPHGLGNMTARIDARGNQVTVSMTSDNEAGRDALRNALPSLTEHLRTGDGQHIDVSLDNSAGDRASNGAHQNGEERRTPWSAGSGATNRPATLAPDSFVTPRNGSPVGASDRLLDLSL